MMLKKYYLNILLLSLCISCSNPLPNRDINKIVIPLGIKNSGQAIDSNLKSELTPRPKTDTLKSELTPRPKTDTLKSELTPRPKTDTLKSELTPRPKTDTLKSELSPRPKNETILTGRATLPDGFKVAAIPAAIFKVQVYTVQGELLGETESNDNGDYAVTNIPVNLRVKVRAQAIRRPTSKLMALVDIPEDVGGTAIDQDINSRSTAITLIVEDAQKKESSLKDIPLNDYINRLDLNHLVLKIERLVEQFLNDNFDQDYADVSQIQNGLQEVRRDWEVQENQLPIATPTPAPTAIPPVEELSPSPTPLPSTDAKDSANSELIRGELQDGSL